VAAAATLALTTSPADAASAVDDPQGPNAALVVTGNGFGHGHGMSQWGARGAAEQGLGYQQIVAFYYPGTTLAAAGGKLRVLLTADTDNNLKVAQAPGLRVRDLGNGRTYRLKKQARAWRLKSVGGQTRVYYKTGHWHLYRTGGRKALAGDGQLSSSARQLTLKLPGGTSRAYRGKLRFTNTNTVNVLNIEKYLRGVVAREMPASWPAAALQSQAVAARTYAASERADHVSAYYDLCDTTACQVYGGLQDEDSRTNAAIADTTGKAIASGGKYAFAQFSSSNGGWSSDGGKPYLQAFADPYDKAVSPYIHWKVPVDTAKLQAAYPQIGVFQTVQITQREGGRPFDGGGWVQNVRVTGTNGFVDIPGATFRSIYGLRSAYFTFDSVL
jgi:SpoIID/LytB domain protein